MHEEGIVGEHEEFTKDYYKTYVCNILVTEKQLRDIWRAQGDKAWEIREHIGLREPK